MTVRNGYLELPATVSRFYCLLSWTWFHLGSRGTISLPKTVKENHLRMSIYKRNKKQYKENQLQEHEFILLYKYWWNTRIFPFTKKIISSSRAVKILFLSFTCEDIGVVMVTDIVSQFWLFGTENISINVFIMGYVTFSLGCYMVCCYNCFISGRLYIFELFSFIYIRVLRPSLRPQNYVWCRRRYSSKHRFS